MPMPISIRRARMTSNDENADADPSAETGPPAADETELIPPTKPRR